MENTTPLSPPLKAAVWNREPVPGVQRIVLVASGKGGVGKSTLTVNLARALAATGLRVGVLDADVYGPSVPRMMGLTSAPKPVVEHGQMVPPEADGIACMSVGFLLPGEAAVLRGPMITKTLTQMLRLTRWGARDVLLVDLPPGTGDIHLSLAQAAPVDGAVIITTPQAVAVDDAEKAASMFRKVNIPVLGVVENMTGDVFGQGGGEALATTLGAPLLGQVPLEASIRASGDKGVSAVQHFTPIAHALLAKLLTPRAGAI